MKTTFLEKFRAPISPTDLYGQFVEVKRQEHEPISMFNSRFHRANMRLRDPYDLDNKAALPIYYEALDTAMFVNSKNPVPTDLKEAYAIAIMNSNGLGVGMVPGPLNYLGNSVAQNQFQDINRALAHHTPAMNPVPSTNNQLVLHLGIPMSQVPPAQLIYLQNATTSSRTQEEKDEMKELNDQVKKLSIEVTYLKG